MDTHKPYRTSVNEPVSPAEALGYLMRSVEYYLNGDYGKNGRDTLRGDLEYIQGRVKAGWVL